jgi:hypothetical protein
LAHTFSHQVLHLVRTNPFPTFDLLLDISLVRLWKREAVFLAAEIEVSQRCTLPLHSCKPPAPSAPRSLRFQFLLLLLIQRCCC